MNSKHKIHTCLCFIRLHERYAFSRIGIDCAFFSLVVLIPKDTPTGPNQYLIAIYKDANVKRKVLQVKQT